jgi:DNA-binding XRE family transcriptional regulator
MADDTDDDAYMQERKQILTRFGRNVKGARVNVGLSQSTLAEIADLHATEISLIERGKRAANLLTLLILAEALELALDDLAEGLSAPKHRKKSNTPRCKGPASAGAAGVAGQASGRPPTGRTAPPKRSAHIPARVPHFRHDPLANP